MCSLSRTGKTVGRPTTAKGHRQYGDHLHHLGGPVLPVHRGCKGCPGLPSSIQEIPKFLCVLYMLSLNNNPACSYYPTLFLGRERKRKGGSTLWYMDQKEQRAAVLRQCFMGLFTPYTFTKVKTEHFCLPTTPRYLQSFMMLSASSHPISPCLLSFKETGRMIHFTSVFTSLLDDVSVLQLGNRQKYLSHITSSDPPQLQISALRDFSYAIGQHH